MSPSHRRWLRMRALVVIGAVAATALSCSGNGSSSAGGSQEVVLDLAEGQYLMACLIASPDGVQHLAKGMLKPFRVSPAAQAATRVPAQRPAGDIVMSDFGCALPAIKGGDMTLRVIDNGPQPHEILIKRLAPGKTPAEAFAFVQNPSGPPPYEDAGGFLVIPKGQTGALRLNLSAGSYAAICFVTDPASGKTHAELGMINQFTAQ